MQLRILHIIASVDPRWGGPVEGILRQDDALRAEGAREIVTLDPPDSPYAHTCSVKVHALGTGSYNKRSASRIANFGYTPRLIPWLRENVSSYDIVIVNGLWNYSSVAASLVLPSQHVPYFVFTHGMLDPWFRRTYPFKHQLKQMFWLLFEGRLLANAKAVLFTTSEERELAAGQFWGHSYRADVVSYGTGDVPDREVTQTSAFRQLIPELGDRPFFLFLSRIHEKKGCDLLIHAFKDVAETQDDIDLVVAGPDQSGLVSSLKAIAAERGYSNRIHWPGMLQGDAKWGAFRSALAFVLPSHQENFGIVVAEALACATPVLISDKVNIWREVQASEAGLVEPDTLAGTKKLLLTFIAMKPAERKRMRAAARACFIEHFDAKSTARQMLDLMRSRIAVGE